MEQDSAARTAHAGQRLKPRHCYRQGFLMLYRRLLADETAVRTIGVTCSVIVKPALPAEHLGPTTSPGIFAGLGAPLELDSSRGR